MIEWLGTPAHLGQAACGDDGSGWNRAWQQFECEVLELTNQRRARGAVCGGESMPPVGPLARHQVLTQSARQHAKDMGDNNYFDHFSQDRRSPADRMQQAGFSGSPMGENISAGQSTPAAVVDSWMASPAHCRDIMLGDFRHLGVGYYNAPNNRYRHIWVQNFGGGGAGGTRTQPPAPRPPSRRLAPALTAPQLQPTGPVPQPAPSTLPPTEPATNCLTMQQMIGAIPCFHVNPKTGRYEGPLELIRGADPAQVGEFCKQTGYYDLLEGRQRGYFVQPLCAASVAELPAIPDCVTSEHRRLLNYCAENNFRGNDPASNWFCWFALKVPDRLAAWSRAPNCAGAEPITMRRVVTPTAPAAPSAASSAVPLLIGAAVIGAAAYFLLGA
jgi:uncharacterized protein YkwD